MGESAVPNASALVRECAGLIDGVHLSLSLNYGGGTVVSFVDQVRIVPLPPWPEVDYEVSMGGDSGSIWVEQGTGNAVGLHFAGELDPNPMSEHAVANRMSAVADALELSVTPLYVLPRKPVLDDDILALLRAYVCLRFPYLCGGLPVPAPPSHQVPPTPPVPAWPWSPPPPAWQSPAWQSPAWQSGRGAREPVCRCCGAVADGPAPGIAGEEELARRILARLAP